MNQTLDLRDEIERMSLGAAHWFVVATLGLATLFDGYDVFVPAYVIPYAMKAWNLQPSQAGLLVSSGLIGFMIGSLVCGPIADHIGRKPTLLGALVLAAAFNYATAAWAHSYERFLLLRVLTGVGLGMILPLCMTLLSEIAPRRTANVLIGWVMAGWSLGGVLAAMAGLALAPSLGWPSLFMAGALAAPFSALLVWALPESPRFLGLQQRQRETRTVMTRLAPARHAEYARTDFVVHEDATHRGSFVRLLAPNVRSSTLIVWSCSALSLFTIYGLSSWTPQIMLQRGESFGTSFTFGALLQFMAILGGLGCGWAADRAGRERTLWLSWTLGAAAIAALALLNSSATNLLFLAVAGFCVMGAQPVLNNLTAALYETGVRSTGVGAQLGVGRLGGILGPYVGGWLQQLFPGSLALFLFMACALAVGSFAIRRIGSGAAPTRG
jgi:MFS transporter, AAHS family, 4-hydroxybenzoate transporter